MDKNLFKEFRPSIIFLIKFISLYVVSNLLYGFYITNYSPQVDPVTHIVTMQSAFVIKACGTSVGVMDMTTKPTSLILHNGKSVLAVYEGCNGINTVIVFAAFLLAFGPLSRRLSWFFPAGIIMIHLANLARIVLLFYVSEYFPRYMYFTHKYLFTAFLYAVVFLLWIWWVKKFTSPKKT
jgi:exosortase family protein XrtF